MAAKQYSELKIAATYIGTVVGAGFASGQEVLQFFAYFGIRGLLGLVVATILFIVLGYAVLLFSHRLQAHSHLPIIRHAGGPLVGKVVDGITTFFLFGALAVMAAGAGAIFREEYHLPALVGSSILIAATLATVLLGITQVINAISFVAPLLLATVLGVSLFALFTNPSSVVANLAWSDVPRAAAPFWPLAAVLYASYNLVLSIAVLAPLGSLSREENLLPGAILGGAGLGLGAGAITLALLAAAPDVTAWEVPMLQIAGGLAPVARTLYSIILLAEIYTTGVSSLYGFTARLAEPESRRFSYLAVIASAVALIAAQSGFSRLVAFLFPLVGYGGLLLVGGLAYYFFRQRLVLPVAELALRGLLPLARKAFLFKKKDDS
ncbi:YkvI family membrane protein [Thermanaeromonas sp. C210]|uniref:YkvI family membrane protein n=1 Tax=Thermanaeromonas sp. C210 TaxID=2731925 RepID=UPI00155C2D83|nr:hypothetical protein [Thermanaeromonas sp. C210]GFN22181.1 membrane protein [Thermanaeromonas sp. C210]